MFTKEGQFTAKCTSTKLVTPQEFRKSQSDSDCEAWMQLEITHHDGTHEQDWWKGFISVSQYSLLPSRSGDTEAKVTFDALHAAGFKGFDLSTLDEQMVGKSIPVNCKLGKPNKDGRQFMNIYIDSYAPVEMDDNEAKRRVKAICAAMEQGAANGTQAPANSAPTPPPATAGKPLVSGYSLFSTCKKCRGRNASTTTGFCKKCEG